MFTLHDTIELTKKVLLYAAFAAVGIFILILLFRFGVFMKNTLFPTPPPPFEAAFGKLPAISFGESEPAEYTYTLNTLSGSFPDFSDRVNVYEILQPLPEFYDLTRAKAKALTLGFTGQPQAIGENLYQWSISNSLRPILKMHTVTGEFSLTSSYLTYPPVLNGVITMNAESAKKEAQAFFSSVNSFPPSISTASTSARPLTIRNGSVVESDSVSTTNMFRIDFYHYPVEDLPIYYPDYPQSLIYVFLASGTQKPTVVEASYYNKTTGSTFSDYPIKTAEEAYTELEEGKAHIASSFGNNSEISITDIQLGYFMSDSPQDYLMPVIVFFGDDGFVAYVPAVRSEYMK